MLSQCQSACICFSEHSLYICYFDIIPLLCLSDHDSSEYGSTLLGVLVMQDIQLAVIIAILPSLATDMEGLTAAADSHAANPTVETSSVVAALLALLSLAGLGVCALVSSKLLMVAVKRQVTFWPCMW